MNHWRAEERLSQAEQSVGDEEEEEERETRSRVRSMLNESSPSSPPPPPARRVDQLLSNSSGLASNSAKNAEEWEPRAQTEGMPAISPSLKRRASSSSFPSLGGAASVSDSVEEDHEAEGYSDGGNYDGFAVHSPSLGLVSTTLTAADGEEGHQNHVQQSGEESLEAKHRGSSPGAEFDGQGEDDDDDDDDGEAVSGWRGLFSTPQRSQGQHSTASEATEGGVYPENGHREGRPSTSSAPPSRPSSPTAPAPYIFSTTWLATHPSESDSTFQSPAITGFSVKLGGPDLGPTSPVTAAALASEEEVDEDDDRVHNLEDFSHADETSRGERERPANASTHPARRLEGGGHRAPPVPNEATNGHSHYASRVNVSDDGEVVERRQTYEDQGTELIWGRRATPVGSSGGRDQRPQRMSVTLTLEDEEEQWESARHPVARSPSDPFYSRTAATSFSNTPPIVPIDDVRAEDHDDTSEGESSDGEERVGDEERVDLPYAWENEGEVDEEESEEEVEEDFSDAGGLEHTEAAYGGVDGTRLVGTTTYAEVSTSPEPAPASSTGRPSTHASQLSPVEAAFLDDALPAPEAVDDVLPGGTESMTGGGYFSTFDEELDDWDPQDLEVDRSAHRREEQNLEGRDREMEDDGVHEKIITLHQGRAAHGTREADGEEEVEEEEDEEDDDEGGSDRDDDDGEGSYRDDDDERGSYRDDETLEDGNRRGMIYGERPRTRLAGRYVETEVNRQESSFPPSPHRGEGEGRVALTSEPAQEVHSRLLSVVYPHRHFSSDHDAAVPRDERSWSPATVVRRQVVVNPPPLSPPPQELSRELDFQHDHEIEESSRRRSLEGEVPLRSASATLFPTSCPLSSQDTQSGRQEPPLSSLEYHDFHNTSDYDENQGIENPPFSSPRHPRRETKPNHRVARTPDRDDVEGGAVPSPERPETRHPPPPLRSSRSGAPTSGDTTPVGAESHTIRRREKHAPHSASSLLLVG